MTERYGSGTRPAGSSGESSNGRRATGPSAWPSAPTARGGDHGIVLIWDRAGGGEAHWRAGDSGQVEAVAFSPDGARLASAGTDGAVRVWDAGVGRELHAFKGHRGGVPGVAFAPD